MSIQFLEKVYGYRESEVSASSVPIVSRCFTCDGLPPDNQMTAWMGLPPHAQRFRLRGDVMRQEPHDAISGEVRIIVDMVIEDL